MPFPPSYPLAQAIPVLPPPVTVTSPENAPGATHTEYQIERARSRSEGIAASAVAGGVNANASLVRLHSPIEFEAIYWSATRIGAPPIVPSPASLASNPNRVFLGGEQSALVGIPDIDSHTYVMAGAYYFAIVGPETLTSNFRLGVMPWETIPVSNNFIPASAFQTGIIDPTPNLPAGWTADPDVPALDLMMGWTT